MIESVCCVICKSEMQLWKWKELTNVCFVNLTSLLQLRFRCFHMMFCLLLEKSKKKKYSVTVSV